MDAGYNRIALLEMDKRLDHLDKWLQIHYIFNQKDNFNNERAKAKYDLVRSYPYYLRAILVTVSGCDTVYTLGQGQFFILHISDYYSLD